MEGVRCGCADGLCVCLGVFISRGKEDALVTKNMVVGDSVYGEKRISVEVRSGFSALILGRPGVGLYSAPVMRVEGTGTLCSPPRQRDVASFSSRFQTGGSGHC